MTEPSPAARRPLDHEPLDGSCHRRTTRRRAQATRLDETLLDAARFVLTSLELLGRLDRSGAVRARMVRRAYADAPADVPRGAIGVTCVLADILRRPDERELALTLSRARGAFTHSELIAGAAAVCDTASQQVAAQLGLDPTDVIDEIVIRRARHRSVAGERCRHHGRS